jgi:hypothetical protein
LFQGVAHDMNNSSGSKLPIKDIYVKTNMFL